MHTDRLKKWIVALFLLFFLCYGLFESYNLLLGPRISVKAPSDGASFKEPVITVEGSAKNISFLTLDDRKIYINKDGLFNEKLALVPGYNIMSIKAEDRFGKKIEKKMQFFLDAPFMVLASSTPELETGTTTTATSTKKTATTTSIKR